MAESMVGGRYSTQMISRCPAKSFGLQTLGSAELLKAALLESVLDIAFVLIDGTKTRAGQLIRTSKVTHKPDLECPVLRG